jgi:hypothetical protein
LGFSIEAKTMLPKDMTGRVCSRLTVLHSAGHIGAHIAWLCRCECGTLTKIRGNNLRKGTVKSCGCHRREVAQRIGKMYGPQRSASYIAATEQAQPPC